MGSSPGRGEKVFLPLPRPPETRAGSLDTVRSARPPILRAFFGAGTMGWSGQAVGSGVVFRAAQDEMNGCAQLQVELAVSRFHMCCRIRLHPKR